MTVNKYKQQLAELGIVLDSKNFEKKLRIIAKHFVALADELEAVDNEDDDLPTRLEGSE